MKNKKISYVVGFILLSAAAYTFAQSTLIFSPLLPDSSDIPLAETIMINNQHELQNSLPCPPTRNVTILIHGTRLMRFFPLNISKKLKLLDENMSTPKLGLHHYSEIPQENNQVRIAKNLNKVDSTLFPLDTLYIFGWSGKLDIKERRSAAKNLITDINNLIITPFRVNYGIDPLITIITHSHGGNVALNMVRDTTINFSIENLILLACPVQHKTKNYSKSSFFKNIYSLFSKNDILQILDPQIINALGHKVKKAWNKRSTQPLKGLWKKFRLPFFSHRTFDTHPHTYHIEVSWKDKAKWSEEDFDIYGTLKHYGKKITALDMDKPRGLRHIEFLIPTFIEKLPTVLKEANKLKKDFTFYI